MLACNPREIRHNLKGRSTLLIVFPKQLGILYFFNTTIRPASGLFNLQFRVYINLILIVSAKSDAKRNYAY